MGVKIIVELKSISVNEILPNPFQPRLNFDRESLKELADSLHSASMIQPVVVRRVGRGYQIIAGERRWRSAQIAGLKEIPAIVKEVPDERVLLESLIENLHRRDLSDIERENAIHSLWVKKASFGISSKVELARTLGVPESRVRDDMEAWEYRKKEAFHGEVSTRAIRATSGLASKERRKALRKASEGEFKVSELETVARVMKKAPTPIRQELLKSRSLITPKMAEAIVEKLSNERDQITVLSEIKKHRLTEEEVIDRIGRIRSGDANRPAKEMGVKEGVVYTIGEYDCSHCKKHYLIKCNGKKDWLE